MPLTFHYYRSKWEIIEQSDGFLPCGGPDVMTLPVCLRGGACGKEGGGDVRVKGGLRQAGPEKGTQ